MKTSTCSRRNAMRRIGAHGGGWAAGSLGFGLLGTAALVRAQAAWPGERPIRLIAPVQPGGGVDLVARTMADRLGRALGATFVVENISGGGGVIASTTVAGAAPDGHTLMIGYVGTHGTNPAVRKLPYEPLKDFAGVAQIGASTGALTVTPSLGVKSVKELIALAQERPGKIFYGSAGAGSGIHMTAERFKMVAGIKTVHVGFKGQPEMLIEIMAGRIHYGFPGLGPALGMIRDGRLVVLAVVTQKRSPLLPDVPTLVEVLPGFERDATHGLLAPAGTPLRILNQVSKDVAGVLDLPDVKQQMLAISFEPAPSTPEEFDQIIRSMIGTFAKVVVAAGLRAP